MKIKELAPYCWIIILNICLLWVFTVFMAWDGKQIHDALHDHIDTVEELVSERDKGARFTRCDGIKHLVDFHGMPEKILGNCQTMAWE